jgi:hypothetical protein
MDESRSDETELALDTVRSMLSTPPSIVMSSVRHASSRTTQIAKPTVASTVESHDERPGACQLRRHVGRESDEVDERLAMVGLGRCAEIPD